MKVFELFYTIWRKSYKVSWHHFSHSTRIAQKRRQNKCISCKLNKEQRCIFANARKCKSATQCVVALVQFVCGNQSIIPINWKMFCHCSTANWLNCLTNRHDSIVKTLLINIYIPLRWIPFCVIQKENGADLYCRNLCRKCVFFSICWMSSAC